MTTDSQAIEFLGVKVYAARDGELVTGRVEYPDAFRRRPTPIKYHSRRPTGAADQVPASKSDERFAQRLAVVQQFQRLRRADPAASDRDLYAGIAAANNVAISSIRTWLRKYDTDREAGLRDRYVKKPAKVITCDQLHAQHAVLVCAWWAFRIGNVAKIDHQMVGTALGLLDCGHAHADIIAVIDRYFSWPCDRRRYPFKRFSKWVRYDFEVWLHRACGDPEYLKAVTESRDQVSDREHVPLQAPASRTPPNVPDARSRRRLTNNRAVKSAIASLDRTATVRERPDNPQSAIRNRDRLPKRSTPSTTLSV